MARIKSQLVVVFTSVIVTLLVIQGIKFLGVETLSFSTTSHKESVDLIDRTPSDEFLKKSDLINATTLQGKEADYFTPISSLENLVLGASSIEPGTFGGKTDYTFPGNVRIAGGQVYFTPINAGWEKEGMVYYDIDDSKLYVRGPGSWIDLQQQDTDTTNPTAVTFVVAASDSKDTSRADHVASGTNDQETIQAAIDDLPSSGGKVLLLEGTYNINSAVTLKSNLEIAGSGGGTRLVLQTATNFFKYDNDYDKNGDGRPDPGGTALSDIYLHDMELDGDKSSHSTPSDSSDVSAGYYSAIKIFSSSRIHLSGLYIHDMVASFAIILKGVDVGQSIDTGATDALVHDNVIRSIGAADQNNGGIYSDLDNTIISDNVLDTISGNGINIDVSDEGLIADNIVENVTAATGDQGYAIVTGYGATETTIANNTIVGCSRGIANHIGGSDVSDNHIIIGNILRDSSSTRDYAIKLQDDGHTVMGNRITGWAHQGIYLDAVQNSVISGNVINSSGSGNTSGIEIKTGSHNLVVSNNIIYDMGTASSKGHGITLSSGTDLNDILITGNRCFDSGAGVQTNGILLYAVPSTSTIQIEGNYLEDNDVGVKADGGAALSSTVKAIRNRGFTTENSGTATVSNGNSSVDVSHGLDVTPTAADIQITPTNNLGNSSLYWITSVGASTFTINVDVDPGATTATFCWSAQVY